MEIKELAKKYKLTGKDFWELPQRPGTWIISHNACEKIATIEQIHFEYPEIYNDGMDSVALVGKAIKITKDDPKEIWSIGEATPQNCPNKYKWAMAEKRLKDRLTLKMVNAYEYGIYSEEEADDFKKNPPSNKPNPTFTDEERKFFTKAITMLPPAHSKELNQWMKKRHSQQEVDAQKNAIEILLNEFHS